MWKFKADTLVSRNQTEEDATDRQLREDFSHKWILQLGDVL